MPSTKSSASLAETMRPILTLVTADILHALDPCALAASVTDLARRAGLSLERVSRLKARVLPALTETLTRAARRGRPPVEAASEAARKADLFRALLEVAGSILGRIGVDERSVQDELVAAFARLHAEHGITQKEYCSLLRIPDRTFRFWKSHVESGAAPASPKPEPPSAPPRIRPSKQPGLFDLAATLPGVQGMADTTDLTFFGVPLKVIAVQDPGDRADVPWEAFDVDDHEDADLIVDVVRRALEATPGAQLISDQGTPYMAKVAEEAYTALELDHQPTKEHTPTEKPTLERSFGVVKGLLKPLIDLSNRMAEAIPALRSVDLARATGKLVLATFLRVWTCAARMRPATQMPADTDHIATVVAVQRERSLAEHRSANLFLHAMHEQYRFPGSAQSFVRAYRNIPLEDLREAERRFRSHACRCEAKYCDRYFAAVVRDVAEQGRRRRAATRKADLQRFESRRTMEQMAAEQAALDRNPGARIRMSLDALTGQWDASGRRLHLAGRGPARASLQRGLRQLVTDAALPRDAAEAAWATWQSGIRDLAPGVLAAVRAVFDDCLDTALKGLPLTLNAPELMLAALANRASRSPNRSPL